jgi:hypothetical protein
MIRSGKPFHLREREVEMPTMIMRHTVADFDKWKPVFEANRPLREEYGVADVGLYRDITSANEVVVVLSTEDLERAREFGDSDSLREAMREAGVISKPTVWFLNEA